MLIFAPNSEVTLTFDMITQETSEIINPSSAMYQVFDDSGLEVVGPTAVTVSGGEDKLDVVISQADNLNPGARTVVMTVSEGSKMFTLAQTYLLEAYRFLSIPDQSAMTVPQSLLLCRSMAQASLDVWNDVEDSERISALSEAWSRISKFSFKPWRYYDDIPDTASSDLRSSRFSINELSVQDWDLLPEGFKLALKRGQLIEAAVILEGDPTWDRRQDGLISKTVGESSEMFTSKKSVSSIVSPRSYREIRAYLNRSISIGRA